MAHMFDVFIKEWRFIGVGNLVQFGVLGNKGLAHMFDAFINRSGSGGEEAIEKHKLAHMFDVFIKEWRFIGV